MNEHSNEAWRQRWTYRLLFITAALATWVLVAALTGGFVLSFGAVRLSARGVRNPILLSAVCFAAAWAIAPGGRRWRTLADNWARLVASAEVLVSRLSPARWRQVGDVTASVIALGIVLVGITKGSMVAGGSDSYGYVSQAHLWATGRLVVDSPWQGALPEDVSYQAFVPLGYRLAPDGQSLVPTYAPGFPMVMSIVERVAGLDAVFYVMPLLAGVTVWATYRLGVIVGGRPVGLIAALLLATSPTFLFQLTHAPMSDIPAAAWWTLALTCLTRTSRASAFLMGLAVGAAILTRPNLLPLAIVPAAVLMRNVIAKEPTRHVALTRVMVFGIGPVAASLTVAYLNNYWYGAPTNSGYGTLAGELFRWNYVWLNVTNYSRSLLESQSVAILVAALGPFVVRGRNAAALLSFAALNYLCYAVYLPLEAWWALRFFLPAFPVVFVFMSAAIVRAANIVPVYPRAIIPVVAAALSVSFTLGFVRAVSAVDSVGERRFAQIGRYVRDALPPRAVVFAVLHSGSAAFYSGRLTVRYDALLPERFESVAREFRRRGYAPFLLLDVSEYDAFRQRFGDPARLGPLDPRAAKLVPTVELYQFE